MTFARLAPALLLAFVALPGYAQNWPGQQAAQPASPAPWPNQPAPATGQFPSAASSAAPAAAAPSASPWPAQGNSSASSPWPDKGGSPAASHPAWSRPAQAPQPPPQAQRQPPCADEFVPLRDDAQKKGNAIKAVVDRDKNDRNAICQAFKTFVAAEAKVVKFVTDNSARCGIPADAAKVMKANHGKSVTMRNRICNASAAPAAPRAPSLSDALGTSRLPDASPSRQTGGGTFNTLQGNALAR